MVSVDIAYARRKLATVRFAPRSKPSTSVDERNDVDLARAFTARSFVARRPISCGESTLVDASRIERSSRRAVLLSQRRREHVHIEAHDDLGRERLCRYLNRPAFSLARLRVRRDGNVSYRVKKATRAGAPPAAA